MADMASVDAPFGLQVCEPFRGAHMYAIQTTPTTKIFHGDLVELAGNTLLTPHFGNLSEVVVEETGAAGSLVGGVIGLFDEDMTPVSHFLTTDTGNGTIAGYALVADDPLQEYWIQEDGVASSVVAANVGLNAEAISTHEGSSTTGRSKMELDSSSVATTATLALKIVGVHPEDTISSDGSAGNHCRFKVLINSHAIAPNVVGV